MATDKRQKMEALNRRKTLRWKIHSVGVVDCVHRRTRICVPANQPQLVWLIMKRARLVAADVDIALVPTSSSAITSRS